MLERLKSLLVMLIDVFFHIFSLFYKTFIYSEQPDNRIPPRWVGWIGFTIICAIVYGIIYGICAPNTIDHCEIHILNKRTYQLYGIKLGFNSNYMINQYKDFESTLDGAQQVGCTIK